GARPRAGRRRALKHRAILGRFTLCQSLGERKGPLARERMCTHLGARQDDRTRTGVTMRSLKTILISTLGLGTLLAASGCTLSPANSGVPGSPAVTHPDVQGTVFTIVFENKEQSEVLKPDVPTFYSL